MTHDNTPIVAAADGSALRNPVGPAAWCWYVDDDCWAANGWRSGTNNVAELTAILELLRATRHIDRPLTIQSDSRYAINCASVWTVGWKKKGWKTADKKPVKNVEIIREIDGELAGRTVTFEWIKGHAGHPRQEAADAGARQFAEALDAGHSPDSGPGWTRHPIAPAQLAPAQFAPITSAPPGPIEPASVEQMNLFG